MRLRTPPGEGTFNPERFSKGARPAGLAQVQADAALTIVFALTRLPYLLPMNFSAAYALAFCAGVYFPRRMAWWLPLGILLATDILLNVFYYHVPALGPSMLANYLSYAGIIWMG